MQTISPAMSFARNSFLLLAASCVTAAALACSPVQGLDLAFQHGSGRLDAEGAWRLGSWLADLKTRFPNYSNFGIYGHADASEREGKSLARRRADTVRQFLALRGFQADRIQVVEPRGSYNVPIAGTPTRSVQIDFVPACPHACCSLPTHRVQDKGLPMPSAIR